MSEILPTPPPESWGEREPISWQDSRQEREEARFRWRTRAAQWRALELARAIFGEEAGAVRLAGAGREGPFRGLLHLDVPFRGLEDHRRRETVFLACAERDPVMASSPLIFVFQPIPVESSGACGG